MNKELQVLIELQKKDIALDKLRVQVESIPKNIEASSSSLAQFKAGLEALKNNVKKLQIERKQKEMDVDAQDNEIKKHSMELNSVKSNDAYKALLSEIEKSKQTKSALEDEILNIMELVDKENARIKADEANLKVEESKLQAENSKLNGEYEKAKQELDKLETERNEFAKSVPANSLSMYEGIKNGRQGIAVAPVEGENCGVCGMNLRPQMINDIIKGQELITCDSCSRILYRPAPEQKPEETKVK